MTVRRQSQTSGTLQSRSSALPALPSAEVLLSLGHRAARLAVGDSSFVSRVAGINCGMARSPEQYLRPAQLDGVWFGAATKAFVSAK